MFGEYLLERPQAGGVFSVMAGEGPPSTSVPPARRIVVDGGPAPAMTWGQIGHGMALAYAAVIDSFRHCCKLASSASRSNFAT
jgi:hypothetical protein